MSARCSYKPLQIGGLLLIAGWLVSCSSIKTVPQGKYLLDKAQITVDTKDVNKSDFSSYMEQKPNDSRAGLWVYNWGGSDTTRWLNRMVHKIGSPPVLYSDRLTAQSARQMQMEMVNRGYLNAAVAVDVDTARTKKARIMYTIISREPYRIRHYDIATHDTALDSLVARWKKRNSSKIDSGTIFGMTTLENERINLTQYFRNRGYYDASINNLHYLADTTLRSHQVDLTLTLRDSVNVQPYYIRSVTVLSGYNPLSHSDFKPIDTVKNKNMIILYDSAKFIRPSMLYHNVFIRPGQLYSDRNTSQTYNAISSLGAVQKANVMYDEVKVNDTSMLDAKIYVMEGDIHGVEMGLDGTNKAGDLGIAANISYNHNNIFNGAEVLNVKLRGAYEFITGSTNNDIEGHNYYEAGLGTSLKFPQVHFPWIGRLLRSNFNMDTQYGIGFDIQRRPEYQRNFFNMNWKFNWANPTKTIRQSFNLLAVNYVMMPWMSAEFEEYLNEDVNSLTKHSYENIFTAGSAYNIIFSNNGAGKRVFYTFRFNLESSGNLLNAIFKASGAEKSADGQYNILGNPFAQYTKADADFSRTVHLDEKNAVAMRIALGAAYPYGNSNILPFEKRYYTGGSNSVRGWSSRHLGPGSFSSDTTNDVAVHTGDLTLTLNAEYRYKLFKYLEFATFIDAGNIWTLRDYDNQPGGRFDISTFYKEIGVGAGIGFRVDLGFLIIRMDLGKRMHDPARPESERWTFFSEGFRNNSAFYFAIGYPF